MSKFLVVDLVTSENNWKTDPASKYFSHIIDGNKSSKHFEVLVVYLLEAQFDSSYLHKARCSKKIVWCTWWDKNCNVETKFKGLTVLKKILDSGQKHLDSSEI